MIQVCVFLNKCLSRCTAGSLGWGLGRPCPRIRHCDQVAPGGHTDCPVLLSRVPGVGVGGRLRPVQVLPAGGEHGDQRVLPGRHLHDAAVPGSLPVDEGPPAVPQPGRVGEAQVPVNYPESPAARDRAMTRDVWICKCEQDIFLSIFNICIRTA